jgi:hypothetical protein
MDTVEGAVYVYGVLSAADTESPSLDGVEQSAVRVVRHGGLGALVSDVAGGALAAAREVRAHWQVLEAASQRATVIPVRFGTVLENDLAVRERLLEPNAETLATLLETLAGRIQLSVKGDYDEDRLLHEVVAGSSAIRALRERLRTISPAAGYYDRIRLGEMVAAEVARRREEDSQLALSRLEPHAVAARAEPPGRPDAAFDLAFLVESDSTAAFSRVVAQLGEEVGDRIHIRYVGPLPAYSFADPALTAAEGAWA